MVELNEGMEGVGGKYMLDSILSIKPPALPNLLKPRVLWHLNGWTNILQHKLLRTTCKFAGNCVGSQWGRTSLFMPSVGNRFSSRSTLSDIRGGGSVFKSLCTRLWKHSEADWIAFAWDFLEPNTQQKNYTGFSSLHLSEATEKEDATNNGWLLTPVQMCDPLFIVIQGSLYHFKLKQDFVLLVSEDCLCSGPGFRDTVLEVDQ